MMTRIYQLMLLALTAFCAAGCNDATSEVDASIDEMFSTDGVNDETAATDLMKVVGVEFSPGYKHFKLYTTILKGLGPYNLRDTSRVVIKASEAIGGIPNEGPSRPRLTEVVNTEGNEVKRLHVKLLVLVDLAQPQEVVDMERKAVEEIQAVFSEHNLYLAFMYGQNVTETMEATDYVMNHYFTSQEESYKYLYRAIWLKRQEMKDKVGVWADAKRKALLVFSDEIVYSEDDEPYDPQHFEMEERLTDTDSLPAPDIVICSARYSAGREIPTDQASDVMRLLCKGSGGLYQDRFEWRKLMPSCLGTDSVIVANEFLFENPDGKVYRGFPHKMEIAVYDKKTDSLLAKAGASIFLGSAYNPIIVNGPSLLTMYLQGLALGLFALLVVYVVFQLIIPYVRYRIFKKKYVVRYVKGVSQSVGNVMLTEQCYYCKAPLEDGDEVVAKCQHIMHKTCWDENQYHCPEYGRHCDTGSHYYNHTNLLDTRNASFYMKWILMAIVAATCAWFCYLQYVTYVHHASPGLVAHMVQAHVATESFMEAVFQNNSEEINLMPAFGMMMGFFLTLGMSYLAARRQPARRKAASVIVRALLVGALSLIVFWLFVKMALAFKLEAWVVIFYWIPWPLLAILIAFVSTMGTRIKLHRLLVVISIVLGILTMLIWSFMFDHIIQFDIRVLLLLSCIFFAVCLSVAIAGMSPRSERYFLNVKGAVKEMDIALFKWFINHPEQVVTIGKSIDCSLQMSWDIKGKVAPVQAQIAQEGDTVRLTALEEGVIVKGKPLSAGKSIWLYHNTSFVIGDTTFTYIERDV